MAELKPCPFCGKPVSMFYRSDAKAFLFYHKDSMDGVKCRVNEPIELSGCMSLTEAAEAWNRRANRLTMDKSNWMPLPEPPKGE